MVDCAVVLVECRFLLSTNTPVILIFTNTLFFKNFSLNIFYLFMRTVSIQNKFFKHKSQNCRKRFAVRASSTKLLHHFTHFCNFLWALLKSFFFWYKAINSLLMMRGASELTRGWVGSETRSKVSGRSNYLPSEGLSSWMDYFEFWNFVTRTCACKMWILVLQPAKTDIQREIMSKVNK